MGENRSIGLKCNKDRWGKGEGLPKYLHEKAIWPKCHFGTLRPFSWTRQLVSTASKPSKGERVMVGNGSRAVAGQFIDRMDLAYRASDVIASRAGAMSIAELALVGKPTILVPSPHVAEDHQTHNARSLSERGGAVLMPDTDVVANLGSKLDELFKDETARKDMASHMKGAARPEAAQAVVDQVELLIAGS